MTIINNSDGAMQAAGDALDAFAQGPAQRGADALERAFASASRNIAADLARAAAAGEMSFKKMAANILTDLARIAINQAMPAVGPANNQMSASLTDALNAAFAASRSTPSVGGVTINMQVHGAQADSLARSKGQVAQSLARAVSDGMRRL